MLSSSVHSSRAAHGRTSRHSLGAAGLALPLLALARAAGAQESGAPGGLVFPAQLVTSAEDLGGSGLAFVELESARDTYLLGEPIELTLRFGLQPAFLRENLVQLFPRPLDVPVQLFVPAFEAREGLRLRAAAEQAGGASVALGEAIVRATATGERERGGRTYATFELVRTVLATRPGEFELEAPVLICAYAREFADDLLNGRQPRDRHAARVRGAARRLVVQPLPEEGRPAEFTGAIGRVTVSASAEPRELEAGQGLELTLVIAAQGEIHDLAQCEPPDLAGLAGFHLRGRALEREPDRLTVRYDLVPELGISQDRGELEIPPLAFASFDLEPPAGYRTVTSAPIRVRVRAPAPPGVEPEPHASSNPQPSPTKRLSIGLLFAAAGATLFLLVRALRRARS